MNISKLKLTIIFILISMKLSAVSNDTIYLFDIGSKYMDGRSMSIATRFIYTIEKNKANIFQSFFQHDFDLNEKVISNLAETVSDTKKFSRSFHLENKQYSFKRVYSKIHKGKREYLFQVEVIFCKNNPYLIEKVKISPNVRLPKFVSEIMRDLDDENVSQEEKVKLVSLLPPFVPPHFGHLIEINWKENKVYLNNKLEFSIIKWDAYKYLQPELLNKTSIPIKYKVVGIDSIFFPPILFDLKNVVELKIIGQNITEIPFQIGLLKNLETLNFILDTDTVIEIPQSIERLKKLCSLKFYCKETVKLPWKHSDFPLLKEIFIKEKIVFYETNDLHFL